MSDASHLPEDLRALLHEHIESYEQLGILLLLRRERYEQWTDEKLSARLRVRVELIQTPLAGLEGSGLVAAADAAPARFACRTAGGLDAAIRRLERGYAEGPVPIIQLMSTNAIDGCATPPCTRLRMPAC